MKITCTEAEKEHLVLMLSVNISCPFAETRGHFCDGAMECRKCVEQGIEWDIQEECPATGGA